MIDNKSWKRLIKMYQMRNHSRPSNFYVLVILSLFPLKQRRIGTGRKMRILWSASDQEKQWCNGFGFFVFLGNFETLMSFPIHWMGMIACYSSTKNFNLALKVIDLAKLITFLRGT